MKPVNFVRDHLAPDFVLSNIRIYLCNTLADKSNVSSLTICLMNCETVKQ
jgi:DNA-binding protein